MLTLDYTKCVYAEVERKNPSEKEFHQAVFEVFMCLEPILAANPEYEKNAILERLVEPDRLISFRVPWLDDKGNIRVNRGLECSLTPPSALIRAAFVFIRA